MGKHLQFDFEIDFANGGIQGDVVSVYNHVDEEIVAFYSNPSR